MYYSFCFPVTLWLWLCQPWYRYSYEAFALMITLQSSCGRGTRASRCWSIRMMLLLYTHTVQNWRRTSNLDKSLSNSETSTTALTMWFQQTTYEPATRTVPRFKTHYVLGQSLEWKKWKVGNCSCTSYGSDFIILWCSLQDLWHLYFWSNGIFIFVP